MHKLACFLTLYASTTQNSHARLKYDLRHALIMIETHSFDFNIHLYLKLSDKCSNIKSTSMKISDLSVNSQPTLKLLSTVDCQNNCIYVKIQRSRIIGGTQIITNKRKIYLFDEIIHFSMQFSAVLNIFIVKT